MGPRRPLTPDRRSTICLPRVGAASLAAAVLGPPAAAASLDGLAVTAANQSEPVLCAEKDNVALSFAHPLVRSFRIGAAHHVCLWAGIRDNWEADWTACDMAGDPASAPAAPPGRFTIHGQPDMWLVGRRWPAFWRWASATVTVGGR